jgi:predicted short-subunit dehydrogenase-like oxidoreductase (DUF2520 family)
VGGRGNAGRSLALALKAGGHRAVLVPARGGVMGLVRRVESMVPAIVFLAVPDGAVPAVAAELAAAGPRMPRSVAFVHLSGALQLTALGPLRSRHAVGSFHPLQSFPEPRSPAAFHGIFVAFDASTEALGRRLAALARALGARPKHVDDSRRVLYHAAAVFASNYTDALLDVAVGLLEAVGWSEEEAVDGLGALADGALTNVRKRGPVAALTGPIRRGDAGTVTRHIEALSAVEASGFSRREHLVDLYRMLGAIALEIAKEAGLDPAAAEPVARALTRKVAATRRRRRA